MKKITADLVTNWHKSSLSGGVEDCVEQGVAADGRAAVRDTKAKGKGPILGFSPEAWDAFLADIKVDDRLTGGLV